MGHVHTSVINLAWAAPQPDDQMTRQRRQMASPHDAAQHATSNKGHHQVGHENVWDGVSIMQCQGVMGVRCVPQKVRGRRGRTVGHK